MGVFALLLLGFSLVFLEFFVPGAVLGVIGGLAITASLVLFIYQTDSPIAAVLYFIAIVGGLTFLIKFALWRIKNTQPEKSIYSDATQAGYQASSLDMGLLDKTAIVLSDLKPGGFIRLEGVQYTAISQSGYLQKGEEVTIIGGEGESYLVKRKK